VLRLAVGFARRISSPPIIGATCAFDAKIYKIVDSVFAVNPCPKSNKKYYQILNFSFQLPSLLVENRAISGIILPPHRRADYIRALEAVCRFSEENFLFDKCNRQPYITLDSLLRQKERFANRSLLYRSPLWASEGLIENER
jgi:hypothetical protein